MFFSYRFIERSYPYMQASNMYGLHNYQRNGSRTSGYGATASTDKSVTQRHVTYNIQYNNNTYKSSSVCSIL